MSNIVLIFIIFVTVQNSKIVVAEWVEIPQFSDETKVYRVPFTKFVRGEKYFLESQRGPSFHSFPNTSTAVEEEEEGFRGVKIHQQSPDRLPKPTLSSPISPPISATTEILYTFENTKASSTPSPEMIKDFSEDTIFGDETATVEVVEDDEEVSATTNPLSDDDVGAEKGQPYHQSNSAAGTTQPQKAQEPEEEDESKSSFLAYIPVELFKKVHATLKSQPTTMEGKLGFLKRFEIALLAEIEKRLVPVISPVRRKRESRGDHGWHDEHDDSLGFPSLEGALMAISFLTFAVYLVQLVMMLFRNLGTSTTAPTGTATFLVNRNKRSVEEFTEDTARVFDFLDNFAKSQSPRN